MADQFVWRTMDSAPRDGTEIIVTGIYCCGTEIVEKAYFDKSLGNFASSYSKELYDPEEINPLFWFPLPEKPQLDEKCHG